MKKYARLFHTINKTESNVTRTYLFATLYTRVRGERCESRRSLKVRRQPDDQADVCNFGGVSILGLVLSLNSVRKTSVTTQTVTMNSGRIVLVCRYRIVFDFGTLNLFLINDAIHRWRIALDEVIDKYARLYYELPEETCTETEKQSNFSSECQETQESATRNDSIVCTGTPSKLTLDTEPSHRSLRSSPYTTSSSRDVTMKEPVQSVRRGKRSVASLRACIQRKICGCSTIRSLKQKQSAEENKACQVSEKEVNGVLTAELFTRARRFRSLKSLLTREVQETRLADRHETYLA
ncbi:hypothetical protein Y032_0006g2877 [Ancylostoma ceylanicum]|uniref:Uncharacterized protein n=1 Tax=Ancylostoma ceylanicum TaxID=53326 RepID=A0A016VQE7_9BILA|nr:hypothetical protein Y032_0006g2877 [Ancylostoma ceylanicum]